jgi:hypothetical protein
MRGVTFGFGENPMNNPTHDIVDITDYTLSTDSHDDLLLLRDMLILLAKVTYGATAEGDAGLTVNMPRAQMGEFFEHIAFQIHDAMASATPNAKVVEVPSNLH